MQTNDGGTPVDPAVTPAGGTTGKTEDGTGSRSPNIEDLQKLEQAHRKNLEAERAKTAAQEARIAQLEQRGMSAYAPPADPQIQLVRELQQRAQFDDTAAATLEVMKATTIQQLETQATQALMANGISGPLIPVIMQQIRQSGYQMSISDAVRLARGTQIDSVEAERIKLAEENDRLKKELAAQRTRVPNMAMTPAVEVDPSAKSVPASTYNAVLERGGADARSLMERSKLPKGDPRHIEIAFGE